MKALLIALAACKPSPAPFIDSGTAGDSRPRGDAGVDPDTGSGAYQHTIVIDGTNDFDAGEMFETTSASFAAMVSWDATNVYVGYSGPDLDPTVGGAATKWLFVYLDTATGGATASQQYNTQSAVIPFEADHYLRHQVEGGVNTLETYDGVNWATSATPVIAQGTNYFEMSIARAALGSPTTIRLGAWMINEQDQAEATFAGMYAGNFVDGYNVAITKFLEIDFDADRVPNDPANAKP